MTDYVYDNPSFAAQDAAEAAYDPAIEGMNRFPWLTPEERSMYALADHHRFPGLFATDVQFDEFATLIRRESERRVSCVFQTGWGSVAGAFDLVTGTAFITDNGNYSPADVLPSPVDIVFGDDPRARFDNVALRNCRLGFTPRDSSKEPVFGSFREALAIRSAVSTQALASLVELLKQEGRLPEVTKPNH